MTILHDICTTLSLIVGIPNGLSLPGVLGIKTLRTGFASYDDGLIFLSSFIMGAAGFITGLWADKFDHMATATNFIIVPLSFLSGTFYSVERLPDLLNTLSEDSASENEVVDSGEELRIHVDEERNRESSDQFWPQRLSA